MKRSFLEELGLEKAVIDKIMDANGKDINKVKSENDSQELLRQISDLKNELEEKEAVHKAQMDNVIRDNAVSIALTKAKAKTEKAVKALIDMDKISVEDGKVSGLEEQLEKLINSEDTKYLFDNIVPVGTDIGTGSEEVESIDDMNYSQLCAYFDGLNR